MGGSSNSNPSHLHVAFAGDMQENPMRAHPSLYPPAARTTTSDSSSGASRNTSRSRFASKLFSLVIGIGTQKSSKAGKEDPHHDKSLQLQRGRFIDQSQSINLYIATNDTNGRTGARSILFLLLTLVLTLQVLTSSSQRVEKPTISTHNPALSSGPWTSSSPIWTATTPNQHLTAGHRPFQISTTSATESTNTSTKIKYPKESKSTKLTKARNITSASKWGKQCGVSMRSRKRTWGLSDRGWRTRGGGRERGGGGCR